ncbi:MAG: hypothetical protein JSW59_03695 [Phycisphaerales bacterium]|nr:MAG: hypothetical protein JSW59_03695 [Phycisphaerales bacterium]
MIEDSLKSRGHAGGVTSLELAIIKSGKRRKVSAENPVLRPGKVAFSYLIMGTYTSFSCLIR